MFGDMKSYRLLAVTLFLSLLLHILIIFFVKFINEEENVDNHLKGEPVEIEVIPKEKTSEHPYTTEPETDDTETTLDHDVSGGKSGGVSNGSIQGGSTANSRNVPKKDIIPPKVENKQDQNTLDEEIISENKLNLYDNKEIIDRIANAKKEQPKGEDSASYNVFEERYASYFAKFRRRIYQLWEYPAASIQRGETGVVKLSFSILKDGTIVNIRMLESSGYPNLDREVMRVIKNMGKVPLPESYKLNQLNVEEAYFIYSIGSGYGRFLE